MSGRVMTPFGVKMLEAICATMEDMQQAEHVGAVLKVGVERGELLEEDAAILRAAWKDRVAFLKNERVWITIGG